jgi:hypothetical protein
MKDFNKITFNNLVNKSFNIEIGSGNTKTIWDKEKLINELKEVIKHNLFDGEFYYNWTDNDKEYLNIFNEMTLKTMFKNVDKILSDFFVFKKTPYSTLEDVLVFNKMDTDLWIDNWFQTNEVISESLKKDYYNYRNEYAGILLK